MSGSGMASLDVVLSRPSTIDLRAMQVHTSGRYAGLAVERLPSRQLVTWAIAVPRWVDGAKGMFRPAPVDSFEPVRVNAGHYRVLLLAESAATVTTPATGGLARTLRATGPGSGRVVLTDLHTTAGLPGGTWQHPGYLRKGGVLGLTFHVRATAHQASLIDLCLAPGQTAPPGCVGTYGSQFVAASPGSVGDGYVESSYFASTDGGFPAGDYTAAVDDATVDLPRAIDVLLVEL